MASGARTVSPLAFVAVAVALAVVLGALLLPTLTEGPAEKGERAGPPSPGEARAAPSGPPDAVPEVRSPTSTGSPSGASSSDLRRLRERVLALVEQGDLAGAGALLRTVEKATAVAVLTDLAVRSEEPATRGAAVKLLASLEGPEAGQALARLARNASLDPALRREAALWLGSRPGQEGTGALLDLLVAPDTAMRVAAVQALGTSGSDGALARLESLARDDPDPAVRREALRALSRMGTKDAVALLLGQLSTDPARTGPERDALLSAIGDLSSAEAVPSLLGELDTSTDPALRRALVGALARIADPQAFDALRAVAEGERDPAARIQAIQGLGRLGDLRALEVLQARARSADGAERAAAEDAIRQIRKRSR